VETDRKKEARKEAKGCLRSEQTRSATIERVILANVPKTSDRKETTMPRRSKATILIASFKLACPKCGTVYEEDERQKWTEIEYPASDTMNCTVCHQSFDLPREKLNQLFERGIRSSKG
jgi:DNA-directed RNA polymerase subunit M/transcription elongation factor TFIIS